MRIRWIDIAKGFGIILVTLGHTRLSGTALDPWITSYHMPLFFLISGLCFNETRYKSYGEYVLRKMRALLYPYIMLSLFTMAIFEILCFDRSGTYSASVLFANMLKGDTIGPFWFISVLLWVEIGYGFVVRVINSWWGRLVFCVVCYIVGLSLTSTKTHEFFVDTVFVSMLYYGIGVAARRFREKTARPMSLLAGSFVLFVIHILILATIFPHYVSYVNCKFGNPFLAVVVACVASLAVFGLSKAVDACRMPYVADCLAWIGKNSIILFTMHGVCGACRQTWGLGWIGIVIEYVMLAIVIYLLAKPLRFFVAPQGGR